MRDRDRDRDRKRDRERERKNEEKEEEKRKRKKEEMHFSPRPLFLLFDDVFFLKTFFLKPGLFFPL